MFSLKGTIFSLLFISLPVFGQSPYQLSPKLDFSLTATALTMQLLGQWSFQQMPMPSKDQIPQSSHLLPWDEPFAGTYNSKAAKWSDALSYFAITPLLLGSYHFQQNRFTQHQFLTDALMLIQAIGMGSGLNLAVRSLALHPRPLVYSTEAPESEKMKAEAMGSFYSGHSSAAFTIAVFTSSIWQNRYPQSQATPWIYTSTLTTAAVIAWLRVEAGKHYPSDIVTGALIGGLMGWFIPYLHKTPSSKLALQPQGLKIVYPLHF